MPHRRRRLRAMMMQACVLALHSTRRLASRELWRSVQARSSDGFLLTSAFVTNLYAHRRQLCMTMCITTSTSPACRSALFLRDGYLHSQQESHARAWRPRLLVSYKR